MAQSPYNDEIAFQSPLFWRDCDDLVSKLLRYQFKNMFIDEYQLKLDKAEELREQAESHVRNIADILQEIDSFLNCNTRSFKRSNRDVTMLSHRSFEESKIDYPINRKLSFYEVE